MASHLFDQNSSEKKLLELIQLYKDFQRDSASSSKALHLANEAWHLTDWVYNEYRHIHNCSDLGSFRATLYPDCEYLKVMHDLANSSKHRELSNPKARIASSEKYLGSFDNTFDRTFDVDALIIIMDNGQILYFDEIIQEVVEFWAQYFTENLCITVEL